MKKMYKHGIWFPITDVAPVPPLQVIAHHTSEPQTNYEVWQKEKYGNFIKAQGTEHIERFIENKEAR
jgi:hypothetical protein